jgi:hypothetical protein
MCSINPAHLPVVGQQVAQLIQSPRTTAISAAIAELVATPKHGRVPDNAA